MDPRDAGAEPGPVVVDDRSELSVAVHTEPERVEVDVVAPREGPPGDAATVEPSEQLASDIDRPGLRHVPGRPVAAELVPEPDCRKGEARVWLEVAEVLVAAHTRERLRHLEHGIERRDRERVTVEEQQVVVVVGDPTDPARQLVELLAVRAVERDLVVEPPTVLDAVEARPDLGAGRREPTHVSKLRRDPCVVLEVHGHDMEHASVIVPTARLAHGVGVRFVRAASERKVAFAPMGVPARRSVGQRAMNALRKSVTSVIDLQVDSRTYAGGTVIERGVRGVEHLDHAGRNFIAHGTTFRGPVRLGLCTTINGACDLSGPLRIGAYCQLAARCAVYTGDHAMQYASMYANQRLFGARTHELGRSEPVEIEDGAWLGHGAIVLRGVTIGRGAAVGAGAIVTKSVPAYSVVSGNPARVVRQRFTDAAAELVDSSRWWELLPEQLDSFFDFFNVDLEQATSDDLDRLRPMAAEISRVERVERTAG